MYVHTYIHIYTYVYTYMHRCLLVCVYYLWLTYNWRPIFEGNSGSKASLLRRLFRPPGETLESRQGQQSWGDSFHLNQEFTKQGDLSIFIQQKWGFDYQTWASNMPMFDHTVFESYALTWQNRNRPIYFFRFFARIWGSTSEFLRYAHTGHTDWWFGTWILCFHILGIIIIPTDFIFQRGRSTTNQHTMVYPIKDRHPSNWCYWWLYQRKTGEKSCYVSIGHASHIVGYTSEYIEYIPYYFNMLV